MSRGGRRPGAGALLLLLATATGAAEAADGPAYRYRVTVAGTDEQRPRLAIEWWALGADGAVRSAGPGGEPLRLCVTMARAGRHLRELSAGALAAPLPLAAATDDGDCFEARLPPGAPVQARYTADLAAMADSSYDPDYGTAVSGGWLAGDRSLLLRPDPLPDSPLPVEVELRLPPGVEVATAWDKQPGPAVRFALDTYQLECGSYLALGRLRRLPDVAVRGGVMAPVLLDGPHRTPDAVLAGWVATAAGAVADFYGGLPRPRVHLLLVPTPGSREGGVFGSVLRHGPVPSAVLLFGAEAGEAAAFENDWVSVHELFHLGNPEVEGKIPWFVEGFTTYYQDVLRGRMGAAGAAAMWGDLHDGFRRHCDPQSGNTGPLLDESRAMRRSRHYTRVYWGGACLAFQVDVAIRQRSGGGESLDTVLRAMRVASRKGALSEEQVIAWLDRAAGSPLVQRRLRARTRAPIPELYRRLGIEPTGPESVRLRDDAPLSALRRQIF